MSNNRIEWFVLGNLDLQQRPDTSGKFVQLQFQKRRLVALGEIDLYPYHAHLAEGLTEQLGIFGGDWEALPDLFRPPVSVTIFGGGWFRIDGNMLFLYGQSRAYGKFDPDWFETSGTQERVQGFEVVVGE